MSSSRDPQENEIIHALEKLQAVPPRNEVDAAEGRANFMVLVETFDLTANVGSSSRDKQQLPFSRRLSQALFAGLVALVVLLSGTGLTAYAAQSALPGDQLYGVKIWIEDTRLLFAVGPQQSFDLHLDFANNRLHELEILLQNDQDLDQTRHDFEEQYKDAAALVDQVSAEGLQKLEETYQRYLSLFPDNGGLTNPDNNSHENPGFDENIEKPDAETEEEEQLENKDQFDNGSGSEDSTGKEGQREGSANEPKETSEPDEGGEHSENQEENETEQPTDNNEHDEED